MFAHAVCSETYGKLALRTHGEPFSTEASTSVAVDEVSLAKEDAMAVHKQNGAAFPVTECEVADLKLQLKKLEEVCSCLHA